MEEILNQIAKGIAFNTAVGGKTPYEKWKNANELKNKLKGHTPQSVQLYKLLNFFQDTIWQLYSSEICKTRSKEIEEEFIKNRMK